MFKKPIKIGAQNQLSGKDRKGIKNKLISHFDEESVDVIFQKNDKIICNKTSGSKMLIYIGDDYPLFVDGTGKEDYFPSIYLCEAYQPLTKSITINEGVEAYIFNGANLMWPGVIDFSSLGNFKKDQVVSIKSYKGEIIGVGALGCSLDELKQSTDGSGVAVYILHYKGDRLWDLGSKQIPQVIIKAKLLKQEEVKVQQKKVEQPINQEKKQKKQQKEAKDQEQPQEKGKPKDKKTKEGKQVIKPQAKKQPQPEQSDEDFDFGGIVHSKKQNKPQIKMQKKKGANFSDEEEDKKPKKKAAKKGGKKKEQSQEEQGHKQIPKKQKQKQAQDQQEEVKNQKTKKGKGKKYQQQSEDEEEQEEKREEPKKKQGKKRKQQEQQQQINQEKPEKGKKKNESEQQQEKEGKSAINSQLMDQYFKQAFLNVLKLSKVQGELPIDSGRFFSDFMVLARTDGTKLEIKDSSYKKLGKFYEQMAKQKFIEFKPAKEKKGQQGSTITKIFWQNQQFKNYVPTIKRMDEKEVEQKEEVHSKEKLKLSKTVQIDYVYKLTEELKKVLLKKVVNYMPAIDQKQQDNTNANKKEVFLTEKQLKEKIEKYINEIAVKEAKEQKMEKAKEETEGKQEKEGKEGKEKKIEKQITLNYKDNQFIYRVLKSEIEQYEQNLEKQQMMKQNDSDEEEKKKNKKDKHKRSLFKIERGYLVNKINKLAQPYYNISDQQTGLSKFREGVFKGIQIIADKIINKNVTKISGLQTFIPSSIKEEEVVKQIHGFSHLLQLKFASSANVQNLPGKNAGKEIVIQGTFVDELQAIFTAEYGIKKDYITIQNKLNKKKKNN